MLSNICLFIHHKRKMSLESNRAKVNEECKVHRDALNWLTDGCRVLAGTQGRPSAHSRHQACCFIHRRSLKTHLGKTDKN